MEPVIKIENVRKSYRDVTAVDGVSFEVMPQECFGLLGPNGAGKTTTMKMIYGKAMRDSGGEIDVFGYDPAEHSLEIKSISGIVPQDNNLDIDLDVTENLLIYSKFYGLPKKTALERIGSLLDFMELSDKASSRIKELSGGMKRRLTIVRALLNEPKLLILDEPTTGLDPQVRHLIWNKLRRLKKDGVTILLTTHYMEEAYEICDRLIIMNCGKKVVEGNPVELIDSKMEKYALQVLNKEAFAAKVNREELSRNGVTIEDHEEVHVLYSNSLSLLESVSAKFAPGECMIRQSNLEDLFLKTTGRTLNE